MQDPCSGHKTRKSLPLQTFAGGDLPYIWCKTLRMQLKSDTKFVFNVFASSHPFGEHSECLFGPN